MLCFPVDNCIFKARNILFIQKVMGVMMLAAEFGARLHLTVKGPDEKEAIESIQKLFTDKFNEEF